MVSASKALLCGSLLMKRIASEVRYMSLRTLVTALGRHVRKAAARAHLVGDTAGHGRQRRHQAVVPACGCARRLRAWRADRPARAPWRTSRSERSVVLAMATNGVICAWRHGTVERVGHRHGADEDQHDEAHALLAVVRAVGEGHPAAGEDQQAADPPRRRGVALGLLVERGVLDQCLEDQEQQGGARQSRPAVRSAVTSRPWWPAPSPRRSCRRARA